MHRQSTELGFIGLKFLLLIFLGVAVAAPQSLPPRKSIPSIAKAADGAVVSIVMSDKDGNPVAQGSGFLVSKDGLILTNYHVIAEGTSAVVKLPSGAFYTVDGVVASDKKRDIALIKAHGTGFRALALGNSNGVQVGEGVVAIGNPLSLESTVSDGIISGIRTDKELGGKFLQVSAPISPGSSGGPLFDMEGQVIGITTMYLKGGENLNFAIPINDAKKLLAVKSATPEKLPNDSAAANAKATDKEAQTPDHQQQGSEPSSSQVQPVSESQIPDCSSLGPGCDSFNQLVRTGDKELLISLDSHFEKPEDFTYVCFPQSDGDLKNLDYFEVVHTITPKGSIFLYHTFLDGQLNNFWMGFLHKSGATEWGNQASGQTPSDNDSFQIAAGSTRVVLSYDYLDADKNPTHVTESIQRSTLRVSERLYVKDKLKLTTSGQCVSYPLRPDKPKDNGEK